MWIFLCFALIHFNFQLNWVSFFLIWRFDSRSGSVETTFPEYKFKALVPSSFPSRKPSMCIITDQLLQYHRAAKIQSGDLEEGTEPYQDKQSDDNMEDIWIINFVNECIPTLQKFSFGLNLASHLKWWKHVSLTKVSKADKLSDKAKMSLSLYLLQVE